MNGNQGLSPAAEEFECEAEAYGLIMPIPCGGKDSCGEISGRKTVSIFHIRMNMVHHEGIHIYPFVFNIPSKIWHE